MSTFVFDLDQTVIDSSHRTPMVNGKVDVVGYISLQTKDNVYRDKILPLGHFMKEIYSDNYIVVCTARMMKNHDYDFLKDHGLMFHEIYERGNVHPDIAALADGEYKTKCLKNFKNVNYTFYDDSDEVIRKFNEYPNVKMIDAKLENYRLKGEYT